MCVWVCVCVSVLCTCVCLCRLPDLFTVSCFSACYIEKLGIGPRKRLCVWKGGGGFVGWVH